MVKVRLARTGAKKRPFYHIVVSDSEKPRDGRSMERIGYYDPKRPFSEAKLDHDRLEHWVELGAQVTERVKKLAREHRRATEHTSA